VAFGKHSVLLLLKSQCKGSQLVDEDCWMTSVVGNGSITAIIFVIFYVIVMMTVIMWRHHHHHIMSCGCESFVWITFRVVTRWTTRLPLWIITDHRTAQCHQLHQSTTHLTTPSPDIPLAWGNNFHSLLSSRIMWRWYTSILGTHDAEKQILCRRCRVFVTAIISFDT